MNGCSGVGRDFGGSDLPIIMETSPFKTPFQLWEEKLGLSTSTGNFATQRGHELEPKARASFELHNDLEFHPMLAVHQTYEYCRASLDGYNLEHNAILEIKCPGKADHETALDGNIPEKYKAQLGWQLFVTGAVKGYYYSYDGEAGVTVEVLPDQEYMEMLFVKATEFWNLVQTKTPPPLTDRDQVEIKEPSLVNLAGQYAKLDDEIKALEEKQKEIKETIAKHCTHARTKIGRLSVTKTVRAGNINYKGIKELDAVDLELYRAPSTSYMTVKVGK